MSFEEAELTKVAAIVGGAGLSGTVSGLVKNFAPTIAPDIAAAIAGGLLYYFGGRYHELLKYLGVGILAGGLKGTIEKAIPPLGGGGGGGTPTVATPQTGDILAQLAQAQASIPVIQG